MKLLIPIKRVIDANIKVRVKADQSGVELANVKMAMNPFCEIAVEQAIRLKESGVASEVIVVSAGTAQAQETLRTGLAMGADRGILIQHDGPLEPLAIAKLLKAVVEREDPGLVIMGKRRSTATTTRPARCWRRSWAGPKALSSRAWRWPTAPSR